MSCNHPAFSLSKALLQLPSPAEVARGRLSRSLKLIEDQELDESEWQEEATQPLRPVPRRLTNS